MRRFVMAVVAVGTLVAALAGVAAAQAKNGTLSLSDGSVAAGIGFSWGKGTLAYGQDVPREGGRAFGGRARHHPRDSEGNRLEPDQAR
jgi:hypothetical protein